MGSANARGPSTVEALAEAFLSMFVATGRNPHPERVPLPAEQVVDLFLHGALTGPEVGR